MSEKKDSLLRHPAFSDIDWRQCGSLSGHTIPWLFDYLKQDFDYQQPRYDLDEYLSDIIRIAREELAKHGIEVDEEKGTVPASRLILTQKDITQLQGISMSRGCCF